MKGLLTVFILILTSQKVNATPEDITCPMVIEKIEDVPGGWKCLSPDQKPWMSDDNYITYILQNDKKKKAIVKVAEYKNDHDTFHNSNEENVFTFSQKKDYNNIVHYGMKKVAINGDTMLVIVREFSNFGNLQNYLTHHPEKFTLKNLVAYRPYFTVMKMFHSLVLDVIDFHDEMKNAIGNLRLENILVTDDEELKVLDYGEAWKFGSLNKPVGYPLYMDPRFFETGEIKYDEKIDVYSLGVILYRMLSGSFPFNGQNQKDIYAFIKLRDYTIPPNFEVSIASIITKCLQKNPDNRITMDTLLKLVQEYLKKKKDVSVKTIEVSNDKAYAETEFKVSATNDKETLEFRRIIRRRNLGLLEEEAVGAESSLSGPQLDVFALATGLAIFSIFAMAVGVITLWFVRVRNGDQTAKLGSESDLKVVSLD